jgi:hypothetical protein
MKKTFIILLFFVAMSSAAYSQNETTKITPTIECQIDSVIKKYDVKDVSVTGANGVSITYTTDFYFEKGFLVVNKVSFFNMQKLVSFQIIKGVFNKKHSMHITFN